MKADVDPGATGPRGAAGSPIEHYRLAERLGEGGMGVVYRAHDTRLDRPVALKFLPPHLGADPDAKARFAHEARAASALDHPNICTIHDIGETAEGRLFIVMAYYEGETLEAKIARGPVPVGEAIDYALQVARGLETAHGAGIVHRDVKPANVLVTATGVAKLLDFGIAKVAGVTLTQTGGTLGTAAYMSPEQARGGAVDARTDVWALGVVLYEMLTGRRPFRGDYPEAVVYEILHEEPPPADAVNADVPPEVAAVVRRAMEKEPADRYGSAAQMAAALRQAVGGGGARSALRWVRKPQVWGTAAGGLLVAALAAGWALDRRADVRWAREVAIPEVERLVEASWRDYTDAYRLAVQAERYIPDDPQLAALLARTSLHIDVDSEPAGAEVFMRSYDEPDGPWERVGQTPIDSVRVPIGIFRWRFEAPGYETVLAAEATWDINVAGDPLLVPNDIARTLDADLPEGMVRVAGGETPFGPVPDFYIDRLEVTNRQYTAFVDAGGYRERGFWTHPFVRDGESVSWDTAMAAFVDQTGRPGPATWQAGVYPEGEADHPVAGVSWYEAAAFAAFAGTDLPTVPHWGLARGEATTLIQWPQLGGFEVFAPFSNIMSEGPVAAGQMDGITPYGALDMAGNVREWCWNEGGTGRIIRGGAWSDNPYRFTELSSVPPFDRSPTNGFRTARYPSREPAGAWGPMPLAETRDFYGARPVSDDLFRVYLARFGYDRTPLNARVESRDTSADGWVHERVSFAAAYGGERVPAHLFLPTNVRPPYQAVVYFPGTAALFQPSSDEIASYYEFPVFLSFLVQNGRAVLFPVYDGTFERRDDALIPIILGDTSHRYTDYLVRLVRDVRRSVDYLEARPDIDGSKVAYYGMSWGGSLGAIIPAVETRFAASVLLSGGLHDRGRAEVDPVHYVGRVRTPTLMLSGRYDTVFPFETSIQPMFDLLGTPPGDKALRVYETDHIPTRVEFIRETLAWLDRYLGPVE